MLLDADAPRVRCPTHGPTVVQVPWARHHAGHTRAFDDTVAWLAVHCSKTAAWELTRIAWRTVGSIIARVNADVEATVDRLAGLRCIGIDEISYKRGHKYLTVVVDHDSGRLVWARPGRDDKTLHAFFDALGEQRCAEITDVSADAVFSHLFLGPDRTLHAHTLPRRGGRRLAGHSTARLRASARRPIGCRKRGPPRASTRHRPPVSLPRR